MIRKSITAFFIWILVLLNIAMVCFIVLSDAKSGAQLFKVIFVVFWLEFAAFVLFLCLNWDRIWIKVDAADRSRENNKLKYYQASRYKK